MENERHAFNWKIILMILNFQTKKLSRFLKFSGHHICKLRPTEAPTFYLVPTTDTQLKSFEGQVTVDVSMWTMLSEQKTGENKSANCRKYHWWGTTTPSEDHEGILWHRYQRTREHCTSKEVKISIFFHWSKTLLDDNLELKSLFLVFQCKIRAFYVKSKNAGILFCVLHKM